MILKVYMVVNFKTRGISRDTYKLTRIPTLIKKNTHYKFFFFCSFDDQILNMIMRIDGINLIYFYILYIDFILSILLLDIIFFFSNPLMRK
jgi:hypothetical protein